LRFEQLEGRDLLAGNVIAALSGGNLRIKGDALDNEIRIGITDGDLVVEGINGTTVNDLGVPFIAVAGSDTVPRSLVVTLNSGDDCLLIEDVKVTGRTTVNGNHGDDKIEVRGDSAFTRNLTIIGGHADDTVFIHDITSPIDGRVTVGGKKHNDTIGVENTEFNGPVSLVASKHDDSVAVFGSIFNSGYWSSGGKGADTYGESTGNTFNGNRAVTSFETIDGAVATPIEEFLPALPATVSVAVAPTNVDEDGATNLDFTFTRVGTATDPLTIDFTVGGTATFNTDYTQTGADTFSATTGSVTFAAGDATATVTIDPTADSTVEADETVVLTIDSNKGYTIDSPSAATGTIDNDDMAILTIADVAQNEGTGGTTTDFTFTVTLDNPVDGGFDVAFTTNDGTATTVDSDYNDNDSSLTFAGTANESQTITVQANHDAKVEADETFSVALGALSNLGVGIDAADIGISGSPATGTITNDDTATLTLAAVSATQDEGTGGSTTDFTFSVILDNPVQGGLDLAFTANDNTATVADGDYEDNDGTLNFGGAAETQNITVQVNHDAKVELDELFNVALGAISNLGAGISAGDVSTAGSPVNGNITNDDLASISIDDLTLSEGDAGTTAFSFTVSIDNEASEDITVVANTNAVSATGGGTDFDDIVNQTVTIPAGSTSATLTVNVTGETLVEDDEGFEVNLTDARFNGVTDATRAGIIDAQGVGTITNDDTATISIDDVSLSEGNTGTTAFTFTASIDNMASQDITVLATSNAVTAMGGGADFNDVGQILTISAGSLSTSVTVDVVGELNPENDETFEVNLTSAQFNGATDATRATIGDAQGIGTINNDDTATISIDDVSISEGDTGTTTFSFTVSLDNTASEDITVVANTNAVTATGGGTDYSDVVAQTVTIPAGTMSATLDVDVTGELLVEDDETFEVNLTDPRYNGATDPSRVTINDGKGIGTIMNDDQATISISSPSDTEGNSLSFDVTIDNPVEMDVTADRATADNTATTADSDYTAVALSNVTLFSAGSTAPFSIVVATTTDTKVEANELLDVVLSNLAASGLNVQFQGGGASLTGTGTIVNDDTANITIDDVALAEGNSPPGTTAFDFTVTLDNDVQGGFDLAFTSNDITATEGDDFTVTTVSPLTFAGTLGETQTVAALVTHDLTVETDETWDILLGALSSIDVTAMDDITVQATGGTGTITNDD
jgi:hypothetical protein